MNLSTRHTCKIQTGKDVKHKLDMSFANDTNHIIWDKDFAIDRNQEISDKCYSLSYSLDLLEKELQQKMQ